MISGRSCAIQNTVNHYSPVIIAPFVDKFIAPASRKKMVVALCAEPKSFLPTSTRYSQKSTAKKRMKRTSSKTAKERSERYGHILGLMWSKLLGDHPNLAGAPHLSCNLVREPRHAYARLSTLATCTGVQSPPRAVGIPRAANAAAIPR